MGETSLAENSGGQPALFGGSQTAPGAELQPQPIGGLQPQVSLGGPPPSQGGLAASGPAGDVSMAPSSLAPGAEQAPAASLPGPSLSPVVAAGGKDNERTSSRSPRRSVSREGVEPDLHDGSRSPLQSPPPAKLPKGDALDNVHKSRGRSASSAVSGSSSVSGAAGHDAQHYAQIAEQIKSGLEAKAKTTP